MTGRSRRPPQTSEAGQAARAERKARLAAALRDNLRKRKAQVRDRATADPGAPEDVESGGEAGGGEA